MTNEEAVKVAAILAEADGGCDDCALKLARTAARYFPGYEWDKLVGEALARWWSVGGGA